jgi:lysophospholipase L1-like esterase
MKTLTLLLTLTPTLAATLAPLPDNPYFTPFKPTTAPEYHSSYLQKGDRLAICGDSITEQKMYSRIIETYLTACTPELEITVRQYGWSGERAPGFLNRMTNDVLRFHPTIATTCYGMNDHRYVPYTDAIGEEYRTTSQAIIQSFKHHHVRVVQGSAGPVGKMPHWVQSATGTVTDLNLNLLNLRNIDIDLAETENVRFADVFLPMFVQGFEAQQQWGTNYMVPGQDGVHPGWAGQTIMAYAFLKAMGLSGEIGTFTVDLAQGTATASSGHQILQADKTHITVNSSRYPFCATGATNDDNSIRSGMTLVPFNQDLNRLTLIAKNTTAPTYTVTWGKTSKTYSATQLQHGINLAADFETNPFSTAFNQLDDAVAKKQAYETRQIKDLFHGPEGRTNPDLTAQLTEQVRSPLAHAIQHALQPLQHTISLTPRDSAAQR